MLNNENPSYYNWLYFERIYVFKRSHEITRYFIHYWIWFIYTSIIDILKRMIPNLTPLALVTISGGLASFVFAFTAHRRDVTLKRWTTVPGKIVSSSINKTTEAQFMSSSRLATPASGPNYKINIVWTVQVEYHYHVANTDYIGYRATSCHISEKVRTDVLEPGQSLKSILAQCSKDAQVQVHYNPTNPSESYLIYMASPGIRPLLRTGSFLIGAGLLMYLVNVL